MNGSSMPQKQIERLIAKSAKQVIAQNKFPSTRSGSKEFDHLIRRLAEQPFTSSTAAIQFGEELGRRIVAMSQKLGRSNLDQGVIRQLVLRKQIPDPEAFQAGVDAGAVDEFSTVAAKPMEPLAVPQEQPQANAEPIASPASQLLTVADPSSPEPSVDAGAEPASVSGKIAAATAVAASTEVEDDEETDAESVATIVDSDDPEHDETEEATSAPTAAHLSETSAKSEDADSEDAATEVATTAPESETAAQSVDPEAIAEPVA